MGPAPFGPHGRSSSVLPVPEFSSPPVFLAPRRRAFTLVELLMVIAIIAIVSAVTLPTFVQSLRGNRLRMATRTVVMAGRYARSMAVMSQQEYALRLNLDEARISVGPSQRKLVPRDDADMGSGVPHPAPPSAPARSAATNVAVPSAAAAAAPGDLVRDLDRVRITSVDVEDEARPPADSGRVTVFYKTSGRCVPYTVKLTDEDGKTATIEVDALGAGETKE